MARAATFALAFAALCAITTAHAVQPDEMLPDPKLEARARDLSAGLRCMVCQNQSIDDSDATLAHDIRVLIRERLAKGESDEAIKTFLVSRYGDFILLRPPLKMTTLLLWGGPPLILLLGAASVFAGIRRRSRSNLSPPPLTAAEERRVAALLDDKRL
ncbi:MAG TPA: cytochrome c-type biogenesis protein [Roseiarcus sp.]|jgi:cytochrome c-type biogenesis protein CcmH|nr:cytochrome c-type biogenesis protein [Roseiarcus sp.]